MSKILIVEDDQYKLQKLEAFLNDQYPNIHYEIRTSFHSGFEEIVENFKHYDLLLLDMSMQTYDISNEESGGDPAPLAGKSILTQMYYREIPTAVVVVTMYEHFGDGTKIRDLHSTLQEEFPENYKGYVFFSHLDNKWMLDLKKYLNSYV